MANSEENLNFHCRSWEWKRWRFVDLSYEYLSHFQVPLYFLFAKEKSTLSLVSLHLTHIIVIKSTCGNPFKMVLSVWFKAALALANATQERLELENKLMVLEAKKEQMDTLLKELQSLKEAQLRKGTVYIFETLLWYSCPWKRDHKEWVITKPSKIS